MKSALELYADLIVRRGANVQLGQPVFINAYAIHREFSAMLAESAFAAGASHVAYLIEDPVLDRMNIQNAIGDAIERVPIHWASFFSEAAHLGGAVIGICGDELPCLVGYGERAATQAKAYRQAKGQFHDAVWNRRIGQVTLAAASTPQWGKQVFPNLGATEADAKLWNQILGMNRCFDDNTFDAWAKHDETLHARAKALNRFGIRELLFEGEGTKLSVGLSDKAIFGGGSEVNGKGVVYFPNLPTEEVYTTPDWRTLNGVVRITRPLVINATVVEGLVLYFTDGELTDFTATSGREAIVALVAADAWAGRAGEVALVGIDSRIYQSGVLFFEALFDENAACHIALGDAYLTQLEDGGKMSEAELDSLGANFRARSHFDMMISDHTTRVRAICRDGRTVELMSEGRWVFDPLAN